MCKSFRNFKTHRTLFLEIVFCAIVVFMFWKSVGSFEFDICLRFQVLEYCRKTSENLPNSKTPMLQISKTPKLPNSNTPNLHTWDGSEPICLCNQALCFDSSAHPEYCNILLTFSYFDSTQNHNMILIQFVFHAWQPKIKPAVYLRRAVQGSDGDGNADFGDGEDEAAMTMGTGLGRNTNARLYICPCQTQNLLKPCF